MTYPKVKATQGEQMTEYDIHKIFEEQVTKDTVTSLHANGEYLRLGMRMERWKSMLKRRWRKKLKLIQKRV